MQRFRLEVRIAAQHLPVPVACHERDLLDRKPRFEQAARALVPQIVKVQILDLELLADSREGRASRLVRVGENPIVFVTPDPPLLLNLRQRVIA